MRAVSSDRVGLGPERRGTSGAVSQVLAASGTNDPISIRVSGCLYDCCGRGFHRRDGEQIFGGLVVAGDSGFTLYGRGIGTPRGFVVAVKWDELLEVLDGD